MFVGLEAPVKQDPIPSLKISVDIPKECLPSCWQTRKILPQQNSNSKLHLAVPRFALNMTCIISKPSQSSIKDRKFAIISTSTGDVEVSFSDIAGFLRIDPNKVSTMMRTAKGILQLGNDIVNLCKLQKQIPSQDQTMVTSKVQLIAKLLRDNPKISAKGPSEIGSIGHFRKKDLRKSYAGFPVGLEISSDKKVYALLKEFIGKGNFKKACLAAEMQNFTLRAHATVLIEDSPGKKAQNIKDMVDNEFFFQNTLDSPYIVKMFHKCSYKSKKGIPKIGLMMELCNKGDLFDFVKNCEVKMPSENDLYNILEDCLNALAYLESLNIHHRDIKLENFFLYENEKGEIRAKLGDFSFAAYLSQEKMHPKCCGTAGYCSPEYLKGLEKVTEGQTSTTNPFSTEELITKGKQLINEGVELSATLKTDIWSMGICLYSMRKGTEFYPARTLYPNNKPLPPDIIIERISTLGQWDIDDAFAVNSDTDLLASLNKKMLTIDTNKRPCATECLAILRNLRAKNAPFV